MRAYKQFDTIQCHTKPGGSEAGDFEELKSII